MNDYNTRKYLSSKLNDGVGKPSFELRQAWMNKEYYGM